MKQYIYSRVSTEKQETENQVHSLRSLYPNAEVVEEYISGTKDHKPALESLMKRMAKGDTLIVAALDRLGRRAGVAITLIDKLYRDGITVISVREGLDYSTSSGRLIGQITFAVSENERNLISERTKQALKRLQDSGVKLGRASISNEERAKTGAKIKATLAAKREAGIVQGPLKRPQTELVLRLKLLRSEGKTMRVIASVVGLSAGRVCQLLKGAV